MSLYLFPESVRHSVDWSTLGTRLANAGYPYRHLKNIKLLFYDEDKTKQLAENDHFRGERQLLETPLSKLVKSLII